MLGAETSRKKLQGEVVNKKFVKQRGKGGTKER